MNKRLSEIQARLDRATAEHRLLDHPFYVAWSDGRLSTADLAFYAGQYWRQVEAFPGYLKALSARLEEGSAQRTLDENLSDELDGDHAGLWLKFAAAVGASEPECRGSVTEAETWECVSAFREGTAEAPLPFALGMIYGYESQTPEVAGVKASGLRERYGVEGDGVAYFELHGELDVEHAKGLLTAIASVTRGERDVKQAEAGARAGARAIRRLLDGVARVRAIA